MTNTDLSRRAANALRPLSMPFDLRNQFVKMVANSETFNSLPLWCQNVIIYAEKFPNAKETSVPIPRKILPQGFEQAVQYPNSGKSLGIPIGGGIVLFKGVPKPKKKPPIVTSADINSLAIRLRQHNAKSKSEQRTNLRDIKIVFLRGLEDGSHDEAKKRVIKFLSLMASDKPKDAKYSEDNDLLPLDHPWRNRKTKKKQVEFSEPEYGVKYGDGCCPKSVKRYHAL